MTLEEEIIFYIEAKKKAVSSGNAKDYEKRLNILFAEGAMTENAYKLLRQIFGFTAVILETKIKTVYSSSPSC